MAVHVAKSMIAGIVATVIGGLILIFILRQTGFLNNYSGTVDSAAGDEVAETFSFYSPVLTFFESGPEIPSRESRVYNDSFPAVSARYINWELNLYHSVLEKKTPVAFLVVYSHSDGSEFGRAQYDNFAEAGWSSSMYSWSWGADEPGIWKPDTYTVEIFYRGNSVISEEFVIY